MAVMQIVGGPRDGDSITCPCEDECQCLEFGHGAPNGNKILDGYVEWLMYRKENGCWIPDHIQRQTMVCVGFCPRCGRSMPENTVNCLNCGAEMDVSSEWNSEL
jgi:hypothetical protein